MTCAERSLVVRRWDQRTRPGRNESKTETCTPPAHLPKRILRAIPPKSLAAGMATPPRSFLPAQSPHQKCHENCSYNLLAPSRRFAFHPISAPAGPTARAGSSSWTMIRIRVISKTGPDARSYVVDAAVDGRRLESADFQHYDCSSPTTKCHA